MRYWKRCHWSHLPLLLVGIQIILLYPACRVTLSISPTEILGDTPRPSWPQDRKKLKRIIIKRDRKKDLDTEVVAHWEHPSWLCRELIFQLKLWPLSFHYPELNKRCQWIHSTRNINMELEEVSEDIKILVRIFIGAVSQPSPQAWRSSLLEERVAWCFLPCVCMGVQRE